MKRFILFVLLLAVSSAGMLVFSQSRTVINTESVNRTVISTDNTSNNNNATIWEQLEQERKAVEKAEQERIAAEKKAEEERIAAEKAEQERIAAEKKAEQERLIAEKEEQKRIAAEKKAEQERLAIEREIQQRKEDSIAAIQRAQTKALKIAQRDSVRKAAKERIASYPWTNMILLNGAYSLCPEYAFGITYARVKQYGFYVSIMMNPSIRFSADYEGNSYGAINGEKPFYTGKRTSTRWSASVGALVRMYYPMYFYAGIGYGYRGLFYETSEHEWVAWRTVNTAYHGMHWEAGLMGNIKGFGISFGVSSITDFYYMYYECKLGLGYCF